MPRPQRKRKTPVRLAEEENEGISNESLIQQERGVEPNLDEQAPVNKRFRKQVIKRNVIKRRDNTLINLMRRSIGILAAKVDKISEELKGKANNGSVTEQVEDIDTCEQMPELEFNGAEDKGISYEKPIEELPLPMSNKKVYFIKTSSNEKPKFDNKGSTHPVTFLEDLDCYLEKMDCDGRTLDIIRDCLTGETRDWERLYRSRWSTVEDFKKDFLETYWGEHEQNEVRRNITHGVWNKEKYTMLEHFLHIVGKARMLSYEIPEKQIVADIIRQFPKYIQQTFKITNIETIIETADFLRGMVEIGKNDTRAQPFTSSSNNQGKRRNDYNKGYENWKKPSTQTNGTGRAINSLNHAVIELN